MGEKKGKVRERSGMRESQGARGKYEKGREMNERKRGHAEAEGYERRGELMRGQEKGSHGGRGDYGRCK